MPTRAEIRAKNIHDRALRRADTRRLHAVQCGLVPPSMTVEQFIAWEDERQAQAVPFGINAAAITSAATAAAANGTATPHPAGQATAQSPSLSPPPASFSHPTETPFMDVHGRPLYLNDLYRGASLFLLLSGPSARSLDLSLLDRRGVITMGVNNSPSLRRTNIFTYVDRANKFHSSIWTDPAVLKIVPDRHLGKPLRQKLADGTFVQMLKLTPRLPDGTGGGTCLAQVRDMPGVIAARRNACFNAATWLYEPSINWGNSQKSAARNKLPHILNVMLFALRTAYSLGFRVVYLLGCDFHMTTARPYAFEQGKCSGGVGGNNNSYRILNEMFGLLKPRFDEAGFHVFNCNPKSCLTVFDFLDYGQAIEHSIEHVPQDPIDTAGWYE